MPAKKIGLLITDPQLIHQVRQDILAPAGFEAIELNDQQVRLRPGKGIDLNSVIIETQQLSRDDLDRIASFLELNPLIPVLVLSRVGEVKDQLAALRLGVVDCFTLPLIAGELLDALHRSIERWERIKNAGLPDSLRKAGSDVERSPGGTSISRVDYEALLSSAGDGIFILDEQDRMLFINLSARKIFDLEERDLIGKPFTSLVEQADLADMLGRRLEARFQRDEITLKNGKVYNTQLSSLPGSGTVIILQDISHLKDMDRIKSDFVATVSHDLRSPLTAILGYTELIERVGSLNEQQREFIRRIQFSTHNITNLINDLLDLGRIEAGFDTQREMVSLSSIARYAVEGLRSRIEEKQQEIQLELEDPIPSVFGNPIRLRQMAGNLIGNAVKYTPPQGRIWVRVMAGDGLLIFQVQDTGPGVPPQEQPHIFNKFYRGTNFPSETPGTGLGLAIVKSIAESHQGRVWVESSPGKGSIFTVVLPEAE